MPAACHRRLSPLVEEINKLLARQGEAAQRERDFIADAAHALRTPLAALQLQADVLEGSPDPRERAARLADLRAGIQRATRLSAQLLEPGTIPSRARTWRSRPWTWMPPCRKCVRFTSPPRPWQRLILRLMCIPGPGCARTGAACC